MFLKGIILVLLVVIIHEVVSELGCPEPEEITPCTCSETVYTNLQCTGLNDTDALRKVFQNVAKYHFNKFTLINSTLQYIPHEVFDDVEVKYIVFEEVSFMNTFDEIPKNPGVETMRVSKVRVMRGWDWSKLSLFNQLKDLTITNIPMKRISSDFRPNISKNLQKLKLSWCDIQKLRDDEFQQFKSLELFFSTHGALTLLKRTMFSKPSKLRDLSFEYNRISTIPEDMFVDMPHLKFLSLNHNRLSVLKEDTFSPIVDHLTYFRVFENPLKCDCSIQWLTFKKIQYLDGTCESPKKFNGKNLRDLQPEDFRCY